MTTLLSDRVGAMQRGPMRKLWVLMFTAFVDMVGVLIVIPLLPYYAERFGANGFWIGVVVATFSIAQLLTTPLWGRVSDRYGRRPALLIGLSASVIAYIVFAFADSLWLLLLSRFIQGAGGGTTGVIQAYVADAVDSKNRARGLGWLSAATNVGVMIGPVVGSWSTHLGTHGPGLFAAGLCFLNIIFAGKYLGESHGAAARAKSQQTKRSPYGTVLYVLRHPREVPSRIIWIYSIAIGMYYGLNPLITLLLMQRYGVTVDQIGYFFVYVGGMNVLFRVVVLGRVVDRVGETRCTRIGVVCLATGLAIMPLTHTFLVLALAAALLPLGATLTFPAITGLLSQVVSDHERGVYMGVQQTYGGILRGTGPLIAGWVWDTFGVVPPFWLATIVILSTLLMGRGLERYDDSDGSGVTAEQAALQPAPESGKEKPAVVQ